jgi:hypothetical protein
MQQNKSSDVFTHVIYGFTVANITSATYGIELKNMRKCWSLCGKNLPNWGKKQETQVVFGRRSEQN